MTRSSCIREAITQYLSHDSNSIADAVADLGQPKEIDKLFAGFQRFLDEPAR